MVRGLGFSLLAVLGLTLRAADFSLVRQGKPTACIQVVTEHAGRVAQAIEKDIRLFNRHLSAVTGASLPTNDVREARIRVRIKEDAPLGTRYRWRITFPEPRVMQVDATPVSLFAAFRQLLEIGCDARFLGVENCMFQFEPRRNVSVPVRRMQSAARSFSLNRAIWYLPGHERELGMGGDDAFRYSHGLPFYAFPHWGYDKNGWPEEIMPIRGGKKLTNPKSFINGWQPCFSSPETARIAVENIRAFLRAHPQDQSVSLGVNDNGGYCECAACKAMDAHAERSLFSNDHANHSASYYTFVNRVVGELAPEFPKVRFGLLAYIGTVMPPPFNVHSNVVPVITCDLLSAGMDGSMLRRQEDVIARWGDKVREIGVWDYCWGRQYYVPRVHFEHEGARLKFLYEHGARSYFGENSVMADMSDGPKTYLAARLCEDIDLDPDAILNEWYERFAGKRAALALKGIFDRCRDYWLSPEMRRSPVYIGRSWVYEQPTDAQFNALAKGFTQGLVADARRVLSLVSTQGERRRAEILLRHLELLDCVASFRGSDESSPSNGEFPTAEAACAELNRLVARAPELMAEWRDAESYFRAADFDNPEVYLKRRAVDLDLGAHYARLVGKAAAFADDGKVRAALGRVSALTCLPENLRQMVRMVQYEGGENLFSEPGYEKRLEDDQAKGVRFTENLPPGTYLVLARVRTDVAGKSAELGAWRQHGGRDADWETEAMTPLHAGKWRTFAKVRAVDPKSDGLNVFVRFSGFRPGESVFVGGIRIVRIGD